MKRLAIAAILSVAGLAAGVNAQTISTFLPLGGDSFGQFADLNGVSKDGSVLVGRSTSANNVNGGPVYALVAGGTPGSLIEIGGTVGADLNAANANGSLLVGARGTSILNNQGVLHVVATGENITLADLPGGSVLQSSGFAINDSGSRVVGFTTPGGTSTASRWEYSVGTSPASLSPQTIAMPLGVTVTGAFARGISGDGAIVAGFLRRGTTPSTNPAAWVNVNGGTGASTILPNLAGGSNDNGEAYGVSNDGSTIVGWGTNADGTPAVKWTGSGTTWTSTALPLLPGSTSARAYAASTNAARIVGESIVGFTSEAVIWEGASATRLADAFVAAGGTLPAGLTLVTANGVSGDGTRIVGEATFNDGVTEFDVAYTLTLPAPVSCVCCNLSNVAGANQSTTPDDALTADDIIVFLGWFFANDSRANVAGANQSTIPDNSLTADDIIVFLGRYFSGC